MLYAHYHQFLLQFYSKFVQNCIRIMNVLYLNVVNGDVNHCRICFGSLHTIYRSYGRNVSRNNN